MIDFRYHVVSIVAVFLALALGLFIGSTSLRGTVGNNITAQTHSVTSENTKLRGQLSDLNSQLNHAQAFDAALAPFAVNGRLSGESVVVVSEPGADQSTRKALMSMIATAGGTVTGDVRLQSSLLDPKQDAFLKTLTGRLQVPGRPLPQGAGAVRAAAQLADVLVTKPGAKSVPTSTVTSVLAAYGDGQLVSVSNGPTHPAALAVILSAPPATNADPAQTNAANDVLLSLARDLDARSQGAVIVGPAVAADSGGLVAAARSDKATMAAVSTVDGADLPSGQITTVFALAQQLLGQSGNFGAAAGADAPLPTPSASP